MTRTKHYRPLPPNLSKSGRVWRAVNQVAADLGVRPKLIWSAEQIEKMHTFNDRLIQAEDAIKELPAHPFKLTGDVMERNAYDPAADHRKDADAAVKAAEAYAYSISVRHSKQAVASSSGTVDLMVSPVVDEVVGPAKRASFFSEATEALDAVSEELQDWRAFIATHPGAEATDAARQQFLQRLTEIEAELVLNHDEIVKGLQDPKAVSACRAELERFKTVVAGHKLAVQDRLIDADIDDWEQLAEETEVIKTVTPSQVRKEMLGNVELVTPFLNDPRIVRQDASHPEMNASRVAGSLCMYTTAFKNARSRAAAGARAVVFDIGAGAFGGDKLLVLKKDARNAGVYAHVTLPNRDNEDTHRLESIAEKVVRWNCVPETRRVELNTINYCRHSAAECTCMKRYTYVEAVSVHSAYYFTDHEIARILEGANHFRALVHIPEVGMAVPTERPEYEWLDAAESEQVPKWRRFAASLRETITGVRTVVLNPLVTGASRYVHQDIGEYVRRGGFRYNDATRMLSTHLDTDGQLVSFFAGAMAAGAIGGALSAIGSAAPVVAAKAVCGAGLAAAGTLLASTFISRDRFREVPFSLMDACVTVKITTSFSTESGDQIAHILQYTKMEPDRPLIPAPVRSVPVDPTEIGRVTATIVAAPDTDRSQRMISASLLREGKPVRVVKATIAHARRMATFLSSSQGPEHRPPRFGCRHALALVCLPFAWGAAHKLTSTALVALFPSRGRVAASAFSRVITIPPPFWLAFCLVLMPVQTALLAAAIICWEWLVLG